MKQKMVIKVTMPAWKKTRRSKAMELAARAEGVSFTAITGDGDQLEVVGEGVDLVNLVTCLRKKVGPAEVLQVEEIKEKEKPEELEKKGPEEEVTAQPLFQWHPGCCHCSYPPPPPPPPVVFYDEPVNCAIL